VHYPLDDEVGLGAGKAFGHVDLVQDLAFLLGRVV
jgi:hypothetical protein